MLIILSEVNFFLNFNKDSLRPRKLSYTKDLREFAQQIYCGVVRQGMSWLQMFPKSSQLNTNV